MRKHPKRIELTSQLRRKLELAVLEGGVADGILTNQALDELRLAEVMRCIRTSTCQYCQRAGQLMPYKRRKVTALVFRQRIEERPEFACRSCALTRLTLSSLHTLFAGWWTVAGARATPYALYSNLKTVVLELSEAEMQWLLGAIDRVRSWVVRILPPSTAGAGKTEHPIPSAFLRDDDIDLITPVAG
ncbi:hypothetical protein [Neolewinella xylanilytica]|uniref:hypothetical protein n=1 Tax=Neolewinella xylanilytica TaxID=1514080 RepID=UPI000CEB1E1E|nr:hypothetical protein [Neolewinella xylanilytica]